MAGHEGAGRWLDDRRTAAADRSPASTGRTNPTDPRSVTRMNITELLTTPTRWDHLGPVQMNALTKADTLVEAALLEVSVNAMSGDAWLLFDCRGALPAPERERRRRGGAGRVGAQLDQRSPGRVDLAGGDELGAAGASSGSGDHGRSGARRRPPHRRLRQVSSTSATSPAATLRRPTSRVRATRRSGRGLASWSSEFDVVGASYR